MTIDEKKFEAIIAKAVRPIITDAVLNSEYRIKTELKQGIADSETRLRAEIKDSAENTKRELGSELRGEFKSAIAESEARLNNKIEHETGLVVELLGGKIDSLAEAQYATIDILKTKANAADLDEAKTDIQLIRQAVGANQRDFKATAVRPLKQR